MSSDESDSDRAANESLRQRVMALVAPLPVRQVHDLLREVSRLPAPGRTGRLEIVKRTVVDYLNKGRRERARRLFTELFEPILVSDSLLLRAKRMIPGMVQRLDAGGLWAALGRTSFAEIADTVQHRLDEMAKTEVLDDIFRKPEVLVLRQRLRAKAIETIGEILKDSRQLPRFLETINRRRLAEGHELAPYLNDLAPIEPSFLRFVTEYLAAGELCRSVLQDWLARYPAGSEDGSTSDAAAIHLTEAAKTLRESVVTPQTGSEVGQVLPLAALNVRRRYRAVALYVREHSIQDEADVVFVIEALMAHFAACCAAFRAVLGTVLKINASPSVAAIRFTSRDSAELEGALERLGQVMPALIVAGLLENRVTEPVFRHIWQDLARFLGEHLVPVVMQRVTLAITQRTAPSVDHKDLVWVLRLIWNWHQLARAYGLTFPAIEKWRERIQDDLEMAATKAIRFEEGEAVGDRLDHLLRLNEIALVFSHRLGQRLPVSSQNVARMMAYSLDRHAEMSPEERVLVVDYLEVIRAEIRRSRNWRSPELADLVRLATARGLLTDRIQAKA